MMRIWLKLVALALFVCKASGTCTFPSDLRGPWLASHMGLVNFTASQMDGYLACTFVNRDICGGVPTTWECFETDGGEQFVLRTDLYTESGVTGRLYMCLYLTSFSSTKYLFYQGPQDDHPSTRLSYVIGVADGGTDPDLSSVCNLESFDAARHHILVREDSTDSAKSFCPTELLASFSPPVNSTDCGADINSCATKTDVVVGNHTCSPQVLYTENGTLSCLHSLADGDIVYVTLHNLDDSTDGETNYQFTCVALYLENNQIFLNQNPMECDGLSVPTNSSADYVLDPNFWCPVTCTFESSLQGSWVSSRKGELTISTDTISGFEPYGSSCTTCSGQPTDFECYLQSGTIYLLRSPRTFIESQSVRIYVCLDTTFISASKYVYYQAHATTDSALGDYLTTLNAAQPVNTLTEVCTQSVSTYPAALYSVLLPTASPQSGAATCPDDLVAVYNTSISSCDYTLSVCDVDTQVLLSSTACSTSPFYTVGGVLSCIYSTADSGTTYLTLLNHDSTVNSNTTYQFTCMAFTKSSTTLQFSETPGGCEDGQTPSSVNTTEGNLHTFLFLEDCPTSTFPWLIVGLAIGGAILLILLLILLWYCCCGRQCLARRRERKRLAKKGMDEESIIGGKERSDSVDGGEEKQEDRDAKDGRKFMDIFTIAKGEKPTVKRHKKSRLKKKRRKKRRDGDDAEDDDGSTDGGSGSNSSSYTDDFTSDDESYDSDQSLTSEDRFRKMFGSRYNLHVAMAWAERQNDPELVQDEHAPRPRGLHEKEDMLRSLENPPLPSSRAHPPGRLVPMAAVLGPRGWRRRSKAAGLTGRRRRNRRDNQPDASPDREGPTTGRSPPGRYGRGGRRDPLGDPTGDLRGRGAGEQQSVLTGGLYPLLNQHLEFLAQYQAYTNTRAQMEDEGFFDAQDERHKLAEEAFGFKVQEEMLNPPQLVREAELGQQEDFSKAAAEAGQRERQRSERRVVISSKPPSSTVIPDSDDADTGVDTHFNSRETTGSDLRVKQGGETSGSEGTASGQRDGTSTGGSRSSTGVERGGSGAASDLMSRFYARLQELKETKEEDERGGSSGDVATRNKDRMRIKTALRRLLTSRLFPEKAQNGKKGKLSAPSYSREETSNFDDGSSGAFTPGTMTPQTMGSRSQTFNLFSRQKTDAGGNTTRQATRGRVVFIGDSSHLTSSTTDPPAADENGNAQTTSQANQGQQEEEDQPEERVAYYRRHPLAPVRTGGFSRLYQPARPPTRSRTSLSQSALQREGLQRDRAFLQRMAGERGLREDTRWSLPGERGPENYTGRETNPQTSVWRRERAPTSAWSYNMPHQKPADDNEQSMTANTSGKDHFRLKDIDDLHLRKLLEELYRDKKYMDRIIDTKDANDQTEEEVCLRLEGGREYLMDRARFWQEKGPLPPRPPTTDLGLRLQRERTMQSRMGGDHDRQSRMDGTLSRARTDLSRRSVGVTESRQNTAVSRQDNGRPSEKDASVSQPSQKPRQEDQLEQQERQVSRQGSPSQREKDQKPSREGQVGNGLSNQNDADHRRNEPASRQDHVVNDSSNQIKNQEESSTKPFPLGESMDGQSRGNRRQSLGEHREPEVKVHQQEQHPHEQERHQTPPQQNTHGLQQQQQASHHHHSPQQQQHTPHQQHEELRQQDQTEGSHQDRPPSSTSDKPHHELANGNIAPLH